MAPKKKQQEKMTLGNFLSDQNYGSWAEEMEETPLPSRGDARPSFGGGFGGDKRDFSGYSRMTDSDRGPPRDALPLPTRPPYTAHLGNLSFDVTMNDIEDYFAGCDVSSVRIVEDKIERKPKGFGYVEFGTLDGLKKALELNSTQFQGRNIRISVAEPPKEREGGREITDWSRKGPLPSLASEGRRPSGRGFEAAGSDAGSDRGGGRRVQAFEGDGKVRDFGNWERKGPLSPAPVPTGPPGGARETVRRNDRSFDRRDSPSWGEGRPKPEGGSQEGSRPPRREFQERSPVERAPTAAELDPTWRARMKQDAPVSQTPTPDASTPSSPNVVSTTLTSRPKLNLAKRTVSEAVQNEQGATPTSDSKASPFGAARPIDTAARDKEIEEKRLTAQKKKEEEDKEREAKAKEAKERAAAERAAKGEKEPPTGPRENSRTPSSLTKEPATPKENGGAARPTFEILRRVTDQENGHGEAEIEGDARKTPANGEIIDDKAVKPQKIVRDAKSPDATEGSADGLENDGWSTVQAKVKNPVKKNGRGGSRAIAS